MLEYQIKNTRVDCYYFSRDLFESSDDPFVYPPCALHPDYENCKNCPDYKERQLVSLVNPNSELYIYHFSADFDFQYLGTEKNTNYMWFTSYGKFYYVSRYTWKEHITYRAPKATLCDIRTGLERCAMIVTQCAFLALVTEATDKIFYCPLVTESC